MIIQPLKIHFKGKVYTNKDSINLEAIRVNHNLKLTSENIDDVIWSLTIDQQNFWGVQVRQIGDDYFVSEKDG